MHEKVYYKCLRPNLNFILSLKKAPRQTAGSNSPSTARSHGIRMTADFCKPRDAQAFHFYR